MLQDDRPTALPRQRLPSPVLTRSPLRDAAPGPRSLFTLDLFRLLAQFRVGYDAGLIARAEAMASAQLGEAADEAMAAAVQIDNEFRCRTPLPYVDGRLGSRAATRRELAFLRMLDAVEAGSLALARRAAETLDVGETHVLFAAARRLTEALQGLEDGPEFPGSTVPSFRAGSPDTAPMPYG